MTPLTASRSKTLKKPKRTKSFVPDEVIVSSGRIFISLPVETISELNDRGHWTKRRRLHLRQKFWVEEAFKFIASMVDPISKIPIKITLVRVSPGVLDGDNLVASFKYVRDAVAAAIMRDDCPGRADSSPLITWDYMQLKSKQYGINVIITYTPL